MRQPDVPVRQGAVVPRGAEHPKPTGRTGAPAADRGRSRPTGRSRAGVLAGRFAPPGPPVLWVGVAAFVLTCLLVNPLRETPLEDDWAYALTVRQVLDTGSYQANDWMSANMPFQAYWGALFARLFGFSHAVLRVSTLVLVLGGLAAFYFLAREHGLSPDPAGLVTLGLGCSPLVVRFSFNFMTDVPYLMWLVIALWLYTRAVRLRSYPWMAAGALAAGAAVLTRQFGVVLAAGLGALWLLDRERWRAVPLYLAGIALPLAAGAWQVAAGLRAPTWAMAKTGRSEVLYLTSWPLVADLPWRLTLVLQYLALFCLPFVGVALIDLVASRRRDGAVPRTALPALLAAGLVAVMAWWRWIGGEPYLAAGVLVGILAGGIALSVGMELYRRLRPRRTDGAAAPQQGEAGGDNLLLAGLTLLVVGGIAYGLAWGGEHLARFMGKTDVNVSWSQPYLPWNFDDLRPVSNGSVFLLTVLTSAGAVLFARLIVARYRGGADRKPRPVGRYLLDLVTLFLLIQTLVFCHLGDEYLLVFLPFGLILVGQALGEWLDRLRVGVAAACLAVLLVSALWTRGVLAEAEAYWKGAATACDMTGLRPQEVYGSWTWNCYHGAFDRYLTDIGRREEDTFEDFFGRWSAQQRERAAVVVRPLEDAPSPAEELLAEVPYQDGFGRVKKMGVVRNRK